MNNKVGIKEFAKSSAALTLANIILKALNFFLLPLYTFYLTPSDFGVSDSITNFTSFIYPILVCGFDAAFSVFYFEKDDVNRPIKVYATTKRVFFCTSLVLLIIVLFAGKVSTLLFSTTRYRTAIVISLLSVAFQLWALSDSLYVRMQNRMMTYGLISISTSVVMLVSNIILIAILHKGYISLIVSICLSMAVQMTLFHFAAGVKKYRHFFEKDLLISMLKYAIPLVPLVIVNWVLSLSDRYILLYYWSEEAVGYYGIAQRFANILNIVVTSVSMAFTTFAFSNYQDSTANEKYRKVLNFVFVVLAMMVFAISTFSKLIINVMTESSYHESYLLVQPLIYGQLFYCVNTIIGYGFAYTKKPYLNLIPVSLATIINIALNFLFIPKYGAYAAAMTTLAGYSVMTLSTYYISSKVYPCKYDLGKIIIVIIVSYLLAYIGREENILIEVIAFSAELACLYGFFRKEINILVLSTWKLVTQCKLMNYVKNCKGRGFK